MSDKYYNEDGVEIKVGKKTKSRVAKKISAVTPLLCVVAFLGLGLFFDKWHPGWAVFLAIPIVEILLNIYIQEGKAKWVSIACIVSIIAYVGLGIYTGWWHKVWLVFFIVPITAIIAE